MQKDSEDLMNGTVKVDLANLSASVFLILFLTIVSQISTKAGQSTLNLQQENSELRTIVKQLKLEMVKKDRTSRKGEGEKSKAVSEVFVGGSGGVYEFIAVKPPHEKSAQNIGKDLDDLRGWLHQHPITENVSLVTSGNLSISSVFRIRSIIANSLPNSPTITLVAQ